MFVTSYSHGYVRNGPITGLDRTLKHYPELGCEPPLPHNAEPIDDGYVLLTAWDDEDHSIRDANQIHALIEFFTQNSEPGRIPFGW
jgi:hypothetical protein